MKNKRTAGTTRFLFPLSEVLRTEKIIQPVCNPCVMDIPTTGTCRPSEQP